jgi:hypothetical protein
MRRLVALLAASLGATSGCSRSPSPAQLTEPPNVTSSAPEGTRSQEAVAAALRDGVRPDGGSPPGVRARIEPLTRFRVVPLGEAAAAPARGILDTLRVRYVAYGFDLGPVVSVPAPTPRSCGELLTRAVAGRGTIFVLPGSLVCSAPFGEVNAALQAAVVPLAPLGPSGPVAQRRLTALVGSVVEEILGLSMPCTDGRSCCALRKAPDLKRLDAWATTPCPAHASELDRVREAAGMQ